RDLPLAAQSRGLPGGAAEPARSEAGARARLGARAPHGRRGRRCAGLRLLRNPPFRSLLNSAPMIWTVFVVLFVLWLLAFFAFHVASGLIPLILLGAVVALVVGLARRSP